VKNKRGQVSFFLYFSFTFFGLPLGRMDDSIPKATAVCSCHCSKNKRGQKREGVRLRFSANKKVRVPAADMGHGQPLHIVTQGAICLWPDHQVPVIGHDHVTQQAHGGALPGLCEDVLKGGVIAWFVK